MIHLRRAKDRGHANHGWLDSWHTFSFANYYDPNYMGFSALRVINEDYISEGEGFPTHPHKNMEILTYVQSGTVEHKDSMGNIGRIDAGEFQIMSAGTGVTHSEYNPHQDKILHLYQIWILPDKMDLTPRYEQKIFDSNEKKLLILSPDARDNSLKIFQDMQLWRWYMDNNQDDTLNIKSGRNIWIQIVKGELTFNKIKATTNDGLAIWDETTISIHCDKESEFLIFDLPSH